MQVRWVRPHSGRHEGLALMTPATFIVRAEVLPMSMKTLMFRAKAAPALVRKMKGLKSTLASFITGLNSSCKKEPIIESNTPVMEVFDLHRPSVMTS